MKYIISILLVFFSYNLLSQVINKPIVVKKTHSTLNVDKIEITKTQTIVFLTIENKIQTGSFCADNNIILKNSNGNETYKIIKTEGIPTCPDSYKFKNVGETLSFKLYFPVIHKSIKTIDIIENCSDNCFALKEIILDKETNLFENAIGYYRKKMADMSIFYFKDVINLGNTKSFRYGYSFYMVIRIYAEQKNYTKAKKWYNRLKLASITDKQTYIEKLKAHDFYSKLNE